MKGLAEHKKAMDLWNRGKRVLSLKNHAKACALNPAQPVFARHHAFTLMQQHQPKEARKEMLRALELAWPDVNVMIDTCVAARSAKLYDLLFSFLEPKRSELASPLLYFYAEALDRKGQRKDALTTLTNISETERLQFPFLQILYIQLLTKEKQTESAIEESEKLNTKNLNPQFVADLHYSRAQAFHQIDDSQKSFQELRQAKAQLKKQSVSSGNLTTLARDINRAVLPITSPTHQQKQTGPHQVVLCGHPRSGTTLIEQVIDAHPLVVSVEEQDCFFSQVMQPLHTQSKGSPEKIAELLERGTDIPSLRDAYTETMQHYLNDQGSAVTSDTTIIDKFPDMSTALGIYRKVLPAGKMLIALRDPRDVVLSCYFQNLPLNQASAYYLDLESAARKYVSTLECWLESKNHFSDGWLETRYEDWVIDTESEAKRVLDFLELEWTPEVLNFYKRKKIVSSPTYADVSKPIYKDAIGRWKKYEKQLESVLPILDPVCERLGYND